MPVITQLKQQKKEDRVNVYLDGKFAFGIDLENLIALNLKVGQELSTEEVDKIVKKAEFKKTYEKLLKFAMLRPRSEREVDMWFQRKKVPEVLFENLKFKIKNLDLLDDKKFAEWWVRQRQEFRPRGIRALQAELAQKGIAREIVSEVLGEADVDEVKVAKQLVERNAYKWKKYEDYERKQKISQFLARKGFNWDVIKRVLV